MKRAIYVGKPLSIPYGVGFPPSSTTELDYGVTGDLNDECSPPEFTKHGKNVTLLLEPGDRELFYVPAEDMRRHCPRPS